MKTTFRSATLGFCLILAMSSAARAADWPMWRFDAQRSGVSPHALPDKLTLQWSREYPPEVPAWPEQEKMPFDVCYEPIVAGKMVYMNSARHDCIRAIDVETGERPWTFFADGPIRFAPVFHKGKLFFTSDDGYVYCITAETGTLVWKLRGGPSDRRILGNERLISTWPGRGAPVIADGTLYFAASIWPFMGVFIHAVDPETGRVLWTNDGDGSTYMKQPHSADAFASVAPQGPLAVDGDYLVIPGGRSIPAIFERKTGKLLRLPLAENGKLGGGSDITTYGDVYFNGGAVFELPTSKFRGNFGKRVLTSPDVIFAHTGGRFLKAFDPMSHRANIAKDSKAATKTAPWRINELASVPTPPIETLIMAGDRIYAGGDNYVMAIDYNATAKSFNVVWQEKIPGKVCRLVAGADRLFAATGEGPIYCFGAGPGDGKQLARKVVPLPETPAAAKLAQGLLEAGGSRDGWAVVWGYGNGSLVTELIRKSSLKLVALEPNAEKAHAGRRAHVGSDLYGSRLAILPGEPRAAQLPPYFCSVIFATDLKSVGVALDESFLRQAFSSLRPFGGKLLVSVNDAPTGKFLETWAAATPQAKITRLGDIIVISREGAIPGSANWTHEHADASNTRVGKDMLVKAPMGLLWFGGPSHEGVLPRHGHGPQPQVIDGRAILEGVDMMRALDIYTGRLLWETKLPEVGAFFNNVAHQAGANASGSNFVSTKDAVYVAFNDTCIMLDIDTGKIKNMFKLPPADAAAGSPRWGYLNVEGNYLIGGADPIFDAKELPPKVQGTGDDKEKGADEVTTGEDKKADDKAVEEPKIVSKSLSKVVSALKKTSDNMSASRRLVVMDRYTGKVLWQVTAQYKFRHNGICAGDGQLFAIDRQPTGETSKKTRTPSRPYRVISYDLATGKINWSVGDAVFGTWLSYSAKHNILVEAGRVARDSLKDEPKGMRAIDTRAGKVLWFDKAFAGPAMIHGDEILFDQGACDLRTGAVKMRDDPITGASAPWKWMRSYGCNTPSASENLLTFRSGAAGYFDLCNDGGTGNFGGFRSSCTNNLIVAGGILTVPEYTRTCTCNYQNQTSVALMHMPEAEMWTYFGSKDVKGSVKRLGVNLGAVGDRRGPNGTLWLEYPSSGGVSPAVNVAFNPPNPETYRRFSGGFAGELAWVASSGVKGAQQITIPLGRDDNKNRKFTVRLIFAEPEEITIGQRRFHVDLQGQRKLADFDIIAETQAPRRTLVKEFRGISALDTLTVRIAPATTVSLPPILSGVEVVVEDER